MCSALFTGQDRKLQVSLHAQERRVEEPWVQGDGRRAVRPHSPVGRQTDDVNNCDWRIYPAQTIIFLKVKCAPEPQLVETKS